MTAADAIAARLSGRTPGLMNGRSYAVLCPLVERPEGLCFLFEIRAGTLRRQPGETCFPGGRAEPGESARVCALREMEEELAIPSSHIRVLGESDFLCPEPRLLLQPVLGLVDAEGCAALRPSPDEVAGTFLVPVSFFMDTEPELSSYTLEAKAAPDFPYEAVGAEPDYRWARSTVDVPVWHYGGHAIWGMTGRILRNIIAILR